MMRILAALLALLTAAAPAAAQTRPTYMTGNRPSTVGDAISLKQTQDFLESKLDAPAGPLTVFLGSAGPDFANLANPAVATPLLAAGNIGLYQHGFGASLAGPTVMASMRALWGLPPSGGETVAEVSDFTAAGALDQRQFFGGSYPPLITMNMVYAGLGANSGTWTAGPGDAHPGQVYGFYKTASDLAGAKTAMDSAVAAGASVIAVFETPNNGHEDLDDPFATSGYWANTRLEAQYGGALWVDVPPSVWQTRGPAYQNYIRQIGAWTLSQHLAFGVLLSPSAQVPDAFGHTGACGFDAAFLANTQALMADLVAGGIQPTFTAAESYCDFTDSRNTTNQITVAGGPGSLQEVALFLAHSVATSPPATAASQASHVAQAALAGRHVRPAYAGDHSGMRGMGLQDPDKVNITGGRIMGNVTVQLNAPPLLLGGAIVQGSQGAFVFSGDGTVANTVTLYSPSGTANLNVLGGISATGLDNTPIGAVVRPSIVATHSLDADGAISLSGAYLHLHDVNLSNPGTLGFVYVDPATGNLKMSLGH